MSEIILGISAYYHDSAVCLVKDGEIMAAAQEERFTRKKHDSSFPSHALKQILSEMDEDVSRISHVVFYDKPFLKFERLLETYHGFAPRGLSSFFAAIPVWLREKIFIRQNIRQELKACGIENVPVLFSEHHLSHMGSAFYPSPFDEAAILTVDGVGEWATTTIGHGKEQSISVIKELHFPHSLGLLYSAFTYYCGFRVNSGEYKLMGLAPYGQAESQETTKFRDLIQKELIDIRHDGSFVLNMKYFKFATGLKMSHDKRWQKLFGIPPRKPESELTQSYCNLALAIQQITEEIMLQLAKTARALTGAKNLVMAGGVALNSVANGKIERSGIFENIWIQPASGDAGGAPGAALAAWHLFLDHPRKNNGNGIGPDKMKGAYLGPAFSDKEIYKALSKYKADYHTFSDFETLCKETALLINEGKVIGWFQDKMEFGPRALGNRSIMGDPRNKTMQRKMNLRIKYRESFRPFAPAVLSKHSEEYFKTGRISPYMLVVSPVAEAIRKTLPENYHSLDVSSKLYCERSSIPAVTHVDFSARVQTVHKETNPAFHQLIYSFYRLTGCPVLINTSFNVRGEPIVCTPEDALVCFMRTDMDYLVMGPYLLKKEEQIKMVPMPKFEFINALD